MKKFLSVLFVLIGSVAMFSCGGGENQSEQPLTDTQLKYGIGPIENVSLGAIDQGMVSEGERIFNSNCMQCHNLDQDILGPALRDVVNRRTPEFIMNVILNPNENVMRHPELQKYHDEYMTFMTDVGLDSTGARRVLEYLRTVAPDTTS